MDSPSASTIAIISAIIAASSALLSYWNYKREQLNQKIAAAKWKKEYFSDLLRWSDEAMLLLSEAMHMCDLDPQHIAPSAFVNNRHALKVKLSASIDRGRWFFPNYPVQGFGEEKPEAFRGYRHEVLDGLVVAYRELCDVAYQGAELNRTCRSGIEGAKRDFTTHIQRVLDPRSRDQEFRLLLGSVAEA